MSFLAQNLYSASSHWLQADEAQWALCDLTLVTSTQVQPTMLQLLNYFKFPDYNTSASLHCSFHLEGPLSQSNLFPKSYYSYQISTRSYSPCVRIFLADLPFIQIRCPDLYFQSILCSSLSLARNPCTLITVSPLILSISLNSLCSLGRNHTLGTAAIPEVRFYMLYLV